MGNAWSEYVQTSEELYRSRGLRFNLSNKDIWLSSMKVEDGMDALDIGCAGGVFCHRIKAYLPNVNVTGIDNDVGHIEFARTKTKELGLDCTFLLGDALSMPFSDESYDLCFSHTVMEHIEPNAFTREQYRILRRGGKIVIFSVRPGLNARANMDMPDEEEEKALLNRAWDVSTAYEKQLNVCAYPLQENEFAPILEKAGFREINVHFFTILSYCPDNYEVPYDMAIESIEVNRLFSINSLIKAKKIDSAALSDIEMERGIELINKRFDKRIELYENGTKLWDFSTSTVMATSGTK